LGLLGENMQIACIGSGNMGSALMKGAAAVVGGKNVGFTDADALKAQKLADSIGGIVYASNMEAAQRADVVFLAIKPQVLKAVLKEIAPVLEERSLREQAGLQKEAVLVSMAAGWPIAAVQEIAGKTPVVRIMPNTPALIGKGVIAMAVSAEAGEEQAAGVERILSKAGLVDRLEERYLDAVTGLSGSGPAFVYQFIEALADGGVLAGLQRDKALRYAAQTVLGSAAMVLETGRHPGELKDMVTSPGGTTIAGVAALENGAFRGTVINAVNAAFKRSLELGRI
jgi:pyrroline-5-carboxylate reductase